MPYTSYAYLMFYNRDMFTQAGLGTIDGGTGSDDPVGMAADAAWGSLHDRGNRPAG
jgi:ABC-type glycerol-3-phosphate transport system substrate-binding protein